MKLPFIKLFINLIKVVSALFLLVMLILEAFLTAPFLPHDVSVVYTAIITTLCWLLLGWFFLYFSKWQYVFFAVVTAGYFYFYYFDARVSLAHQQERCLDLGWVWDKEQNICRRDCWELDSEKGCLQKK